MVVCYPQDGKQKSRDICRAFALGCGGVVDCSGVYKPEHDAFFYGIDVANEKVWQQCQQNKERDFYYSDNAFFDQMRGKMFRVGKNRLQHPGTGKSDGSRFKALGLDVKPWRHDGSFVLLTPQSEHFMRVAAGYETWLLDTESRLRGLTSRELRVRTWNRDKHKLAVQLPQALTGAWALVTFSSGSAISAILMGIPAISTAPDCIARQMCGGLDSIETPARPEREPWLHVVADQQWTLDEFCDGTAWRALQ